MTSSGTSRASGELPPPNTSTQAQIPASVILLATAVTVFEYLGYRCEVFACVYNAFAPPNDRRYYYAPPLAVVRSPESNEPDTRLVKLVGEFYKVSLLSEFDPPAVHRMALAALESVLPAVEFAALKPTNVRPLPVAKVSWRVVDPLPLEQLGITFYNSCVPALTTGCRFPLEVMVNSEAMARQMCARFTRLTLMARLTFYARTVPNATAAAAISAYRAAMSSSSSSVDTGASKTVMITTIDLLRSNAWKALSDRAEARPGAAASGTLPAVKLEPGVKTEPGLSKRGTGKTGAGKTGGLVDDLVGFLAAEKLAFVAQVVRMYDEFCREIGARPALRMVEGSTAYNKLRELVAKHVTAASRRHVLWENNAAQVADLSHAPCLLQGVDMCQAQLARALNDLFVRVSDVFRFDVQAALNHRWNVWGWPEAMTATTVTTTWTPAELQRELRERCGIWVEFLGEPARIVPVKFEVVALSLAGLMPNGRERNIGCLHTAPVPPTTTTAGAAVPTTTAAASAAATGPVFPDDGRRVHREVQLTHPMKDDDDPGAALVGPAKRRRADDDDDEMEEEKDEKEEEEKEPEAKRRCEREESEELKELRAQVRFLTEELGRLEREVGGRRETSSTTTS